MTENIKWKRFSVRRYDTYFMDHIRMDAFTVISILTSQ